MLPPPSAGGLGAAVGWEIVGLPGHAMLAIHTRPQATLGLAVGVGAALVPEGALERASVQSCATPRPQFKQPCRSP